MKEAIRKYTCASKEPRQKSTRWELAYHGGDLGVDQIQDDERHGRVSGEELPDVTLLAIQSTPEDGEGGRGQERPD